MVQLYHNRNVNKNSLLFKVDYTRFVFSVIILSFIRSLLSISNTEYCILCPNRFMGICFVHLRFGLIGQVVLTSI